MSSRFEPIIDNPVLTCPFWHMCNLPKSEPICGFPEYKICPDYKNKIGILNKTS